MTRRRRDLLAAALAMLAYLGLAVVGSRPPGRHERRLFKSANRGPGPQPELEPAQQLGTPWVLPGLAVIALATRRRSLAAAAGLALPVEKACEVATKRITQRPRPAKTVPDTELRDDAPTRGPAFPSGHAAIASCAVWLVAPYAGRGLTSLLGATAAVTMYRRVHQGAHYPTDVVGGSLLGVAVGTTLSYVFGRPALA